MSAVPIADQEARWRSWRQLGKIDQYSRATQHPPDHCLAGRIDAVHLEDVLRQVRSERRINESGTEEALV